jgi:hypothetical protein
MSNFGESSYYGGSYAKDQNENTCETCDIKINCRYHKIATQLGKTREIARNSWERSKKLLALLKNNLKIHIGNKQDIYLPVFIALILLALVFLSKTAFSKTVDTANNLPVEDNYKVKMIGIADNNSQSDETCSASEAYLEKLAEEKLKESDLKKDVARIVNGTPMSAMVDAISEKSKPVAAFIVGIAMKESKFGVYSPKLAGRDCYNYWGFKGGGTTVSGGYSCFASPEQAVDAVGGRIEKMVAKGVRTPAQAISWKCGSSCAGHGEENVRKWIADVAINFYKINS